VLAQTSVRKILNGRQVDEVRDAPSNSACHGPDVVGGEAQVVQDSLDEMRSRIMQDPPPVTQGPIPRVPRAMEACGRR
jgi:hypothetical protein